MPMCGSKFEEGQARSVYLSIGYRSFDGSRSYCGHALRVYFLSLGVYYLSPGFNVLLQEFNIYVPVFIILIYLIFIAQDQCQPDLYLLYTICESCVSYNNFLSAYDEHWSIK